MGKKKDDIELEMEVTFEEEPAVVEAKPKGGAKAKDDAKYRKTNQGRSPERASLFLAPLHLLLHGNQEEVGGPWASSECSACNSLVFRCAESVTVPILSYEADTAAHTDESHGSLVVRTVCSSDCRRAWP